MLEVRLTIEARADFESIAGFSIERFGFKQAEHYRGHLLQAFSFLAEFPNLGSDQSDVRPETRRFVHESHSIYYQILGSELWILRILGPGQDPSRHLSAVKLEFRN